MNERFIAGPFLLAKESGKLDGGLLTVSACLADIVPDSWAIEWVREEEAARLERAATFGIDDRQLPSAIRWVTDHFGEGGFAWPNVFLNAAVAKEFHQRFVTGTIRLLQMSLPEDLIESFLDLTAPRQQPGYAPIGASGVHQVLAKRSPLTESGERRGFEVLGVDGAAGFDSFRCNGLEADFERLFGIQFNQWGLIDDLADAARCARFANSPDVSTCAIGWHPWLITEHVI